MGVFRKVKTTLLNNAQNGLVTQLLSQIYTRLFTDCNLAEGTTAGKALVNGNTYCWPEYMIDGVHYQLTSSELDDFFDCTGLASHSDADGDFDLSLPHCYVLFTVTAAGAGVATRGKPAATAAAAEIPDVPDDECPVGYVLLDISTLSSSGTTGCYNWDQELGSHGTFGSGLPLAYYTEAINAA